MNETNLKGPSETDWVRIDEMTDDGIDTSDIPLLDEAFFAAAEWRMPEKKNPLNGKHDDVALTTEKGGRTT